MSASFCKSKVISNDEIFENIKLMRVEYSGNVKPGQFFMLRCWDDATPPLLPRPISVHDYKDGVLTFLYEVKGTGTQKIAQLSKGDEIALTGSAGNGFPINDIKGKVAVVSGGIGIAPLLYLVKRLTDCTVDLFTGFRDTPYAIDSFKPFVNSVNIATDTGNVGQKGFVTDLFNVTDYDVVLTCGPEIMMEKLARNCIKNNVEVYVSKENKMACGIGACLGCTCKTKNGGKSVCKDGPVFKGTEVYYE